MKRKLRGITAGLLAGTILLGGCSSPTASSNKEEKSAVSETAQPKEIKAEQTSASKKVLCGTIIQAEGKVPNFTKTELEFSENKIAFQFIRYYVDTGLSDEIYKKSFKDFDHIERKDGFVLVYQQKDEAEVEGAEKPEFQQEYLIGLQGSFKEDGIDLATDISEQDVQRYLLELKKIWQDDSKEKNLSKPAQQPETAASGIRPEFQKMMDDYLAFFQMYADFMNRYKNSENPASMMTDYLSFLSQYSEMMESLDALDDQEMSSEETALYLQTTVKIQQIIAGAM